MSLPFFYQHGKRAVQSLLNTAIKTVVDSVIKIAHAQNSSIKVGRLKRSKRDESDKKKQNRIKSKSKKKAAQWQPFNISN